MFFFYVCGTQDTRKFLEPSDLAIVAKAFIIQLSYAVKEHLTRKRKQSFYSLKLQFEVLQFVLCNMSTRNLQNTVILQFQLIQASS